jgi:hypothetical protein
VEAARVNSGHFGSSSQVLIHYCTKPKGILSKAFFPIQHGDCMLLILFVLPM